MEWNRSNSNGAVAQTQNQQYLMPSSSSMVADGHSQLTSVNQQSIIQNISFHSDKGPLLQNLLKAKSSEELSRVEQAALGNYRSSQTNRLSNQMKQSLQMSSYKPVQETVPIPDNRSAIQSNLGPNYRIPPYTNSVQQTPQQPPSLAVGQQLGGNGYNTTAVQQPLQNCQALQNYQPTVSYTFSQQNTVCNLVRPSNAIQMSCQPMASNVPPSNMYSLQNGATGQYMSSQKLPAETNISNPMQNCLNSQNVTSQSLTNYRSNMLPHASQQQVSMPQLQTIQPVDVNVNCFSQSQQRQTIQNVLISSSQILGAAAAKPPPAYTTTNSANVFNASLNQNFNKPRQNYVAPNVQQPKQTNNVPTVQNSIGDGQSVHMRTVSQDQKYEMLKLLLVYRNVRQKYALLNQENNLLRQRLQANTSQENSGPPPLLSSLPTTQLQANCVVAGQQFVTPAVPVQNSAQINYSSFPSQNKHDQVGNAPNQAAIPQNLSLQENAAFLNQMLKSDNGNFHTQNNSLFDGGISNVENGLTSVLQLHNSETNKVTSREFRGQTNSDHYASSPNSSNENVLKNAQGLHSLDTSASVTQSLNPVSPEKTSYGHLSSPTSLIANKQVTSLSREAIEASLPLWKTVPQSANGFSETQHNQSPVESSLADFRFLDEITAGPTNEVSSTIPVQKQDSAIQNQANPQIAIVSPLVQSKEALHDYKLSKVHIQSPQVENTTINGLISSHESECFSKILQALESFGSNAMHNLDAPRHKEPPAAIQDNLDSSLLLNAEASSQIEVKRSSEDIEIVDDTFKISGICSLAEGNTFYNSSIAMMFEESPGNATLPPTDTRNDHSKTEDAVCISKALDSTAIKPTPIVIKSEPVDEVAVSQSTEGGLHCNKIPCTVTQADHHMGSIQEESCCDLEQSTVDDQLTELLTEFPYGIKNDISENILENINGHLVKIKDNLVLKAPVAPEDYKPVECKAFIDSQSEMVPSPSVSLKHVDESVSEPLLDLKPLAEKLLSEVQQTKGVLIPTKDVNGESIPAMDICVNDCIEILSNSPASDIQITLLDQEDISKIFPNEKIDSETCSEDKLEMLQECIKTAKPEIELQSLKDSTDPMETGTDNEYCCFFGWLNRTNKNAPKCNCKRVESCTVDPTNLSNSGTVSNHELPLPGLSKPNKVGLEIFQLNDRPPRLELVDSEGEEILQPMEKPPKLEKMVSKGECIQKHSLHFASQAKKSLKSSNQNVKSVKDDLLNNEKSLTPSPGNGEPETTSTTFKNRVQSPQKLKSHGSRKSEKLIVKTDFLKSKHPYKEKRKSEEKNTTKFLQWTSNKCSSQSGFSKNVPGKCEKKPQKERVEQNMTTAGVERSPDQQKVGTWKRQNSSPGVDMSSHTHGVKKRKEKESHFEKTRKVPSVQEYLERKRELCKKRTEARTDSREGLGEERDTADRPSETSGNVQLDLKRPLSPAKTVTPKEKNGHSGIQTGLHRKEYLQSGGHYEARHRRRSGQRKVPENKTENLNRSSSKDKIYLSPCVSSRRASCEGISLAKLQIRHSPEKPKYSDERTLLESSGYIKSSNSVVKNDSPKMLEFKLYPEFADGSLTTQDKTKEAMDPKTKCVVEGRW